MAATLLEMTQDILSAMDSDEVDSITDTAESLQVATAIKDSYNYLIRSLDLTEHYTHFELIASGNVLYPHIMTLPSNCDEVLWIKYNRAELDDTLSKYEDIEYLEKEDFFTRMYNLYTEADGVIEVNWEMNDDPIATFYRTDRHPTYYTELDDRTIIFDAVDLTIEPTLTKANTVAYGKLRTDFDLDDDYVPALNDKQFALLYNEAKAQCFIELKQQQNPIAERRARKGWIRTQSKKDSVQDPYENYRYHSIGRRR